MVEVDNMNIVSVVVIESFDLTVEKIRNKEGIDYRTSWMVVILENVEKDYMVEIQNFVVGIHLAERVINDGINDRTDFEEN